MSKAEREALRDNRAAKLVNGLIDRGVVKRTVMTSVYGVTFIGAKKQIQEKIEEKVRFDCSKLLKDRLFLTSPLVTFFSWKIKVTIYMK